MQIITERIPDFQRFSIKINLKKINLKRLKLGFSNATVCRPTLKKT
jgi:hypothetical protein